jgi:hypothetical protein
VRLFGKPRQTPLAVPEINVPDCFQIPPKTQWGFTPSLQYGITQDGISGKILTGTSLGPDVTLHHEGDAATFSVRRPDDYGAGLVFEFSEFKGDYFSLAFELPVEGVMALGRQDLLRLNLRSHANEPLKAYARLNLCHGPNTEQIVRMIDVGEGESFTEFDIFYTEFEQKRAASAWIDLIINDPAHKTIALEEVVILRRVRACL